MQINIITPMEIENEKVVNAIARILNKKHNYRLITSEIGREATAKTMMNLPSSDCTILLGFAAIVGKESDMPNELNFGKPIEITTASLYGYEGELFENGKPIHVEPKLNLPCLSSLTSDKFVRTTDLAKKTVVNM